jgi:hypothetical protein
MAMTPRQIEIHIEELVLHGVDPADRHAVADAIQRELQALVAREGISTLLARPELAARVAPGPITLAPEARPAQLGQSVARAIHQGWK